MIRIGIAEDNNFLAQSIINKLGIFDDCKVKFHVLDGEDLMHRLDQDSNLDVILMDIQMPIMNGITATKLVSQKFPHIKTVMLTISDDEKEIHESIKAGALGYLLKESSPQEIYDSLIEVVGGGSPMSPSVARKAIRLIQNPNQIEKEKKEFDLSKREVEVLQQLCKGLNYNEIADNLIISPNTVRRHIENLYKKLEVNNKASAILIAYSNQLV